MSETEILKAVIKDVVKEAVQESISEVMKEANKLPAVLDQTQVMALLGVSRPKASQLFNRKDFPVTRILGNPRVVTSELLKWLIENSNNEYQLQSKSIDKVAEMRKAGKGVS